MQDHITVYCHKITNRIKYIFDFIFESILNIKIELTDDIEYFENCETAKFCYSKIDQTDEFITQEAHNLLFEKGIIEQALNFSNYQSEKTFFLCSKKSLLPFDIFAASFFLLSRYEEYLDFKPDKHGRFPAKESIAYKKGFLEEPIINNWAYLLKSRLLDEFPYLKFGNSSFKYISTIDIDNAYAHLYKGLIRTTLSIIQALLKNKILFNEKIKVLLGQIKDPYDNYKFLDKIHSKYGTKAIYFILYSRYGKYDKNVPRKIKAFKNLIQKISTKYPLGLHPSFQSNRNFEILKEEKNRYEQVVGYNIKKSRQHFLMLKIPETYSNLIKLGIEEDYSMGYASMPGFRAGTCTPFYFYDLKSDKRTSLKVFPFQVMDVCFKDYLRCSPDETLKKIKKIITSIKKVDGLFVSLWHNETLTEKISNADKPEETWRNTYEQMLNEAKH